MTDLDQIEAQSIFIPRDACHRLRPPAVLWSPGKDGDVPVRLARKAFPGRVPVPVPHVDTGETLPRLYAFRDEYAAKWGLHVGACSPVGETDPTSPPAPPRARPRAWSPGPAATSSRPGPGRACSARVAPAGLVTRAAHLG